MSFESPWALAGLLLFWPFWRWLKQQQPQLWPVGGLQPFQASKVQAARQKALRPPAFWWLLAAYGLACLSLSQPRLGHPSPLLVVDHSRSVQESGLEPPRGFAEVRLIGDWQQAVGQKALLAALEEVSPGRPVVVWTDQPPPTHLPAWVEWRNQDFAGSDVGGRILDALPREDGRWVVSWMLAPGQQARIRQGDWQSVMLQGGAGLLEVEVGKLPAVLEMIQNEGARMDQWSLPSVEFVLPPQASSAWCAALQALWPTASCRLGQQAQDAEVLQIWWNGKAVPLPQEWLSLNWVPAPSEEQLQTLFAPWHAWFRAKYPPLPPQEAWPGQDQADASFLPRQGAPPNTLPLARIIWALSLICAGVGWWLLPQRQKNHDYSSAV